MKAILFKMYHNIIALIMVDNNHGFTVHSVPGLCHEVFDTVSIIWKRSRYVMCVYRFQICSPRPLQQTVADLH